jgi:hypothetical protein
MKTLFCVILLIVFGIIANFLSIIILNVAGLPGALLAGFPGKRSRGQFIFGSVVSALGQSYVYLAFIAVIVGWTTLAANREDVIGLLLYPFAFLTTFVPIWFALIRARVEAREQKDASVQVEALHITVIVAFVGFFVFVFAPSVMRFAWGWLPYVR